MDRLALVADTHAYQAGLPRLLAFFQDQGIRHLACLGDCQPEPFRPWLEMDPGHRLYWVYDTFGPQLPEAIGNGGGPGTGGEGLFGPYPGHDLDSLQ